MRAMTSNSPANRRSTLLYCAAKASKQPAAKLSAWVNGPAWISQPRQCRPRHHSC